MEKGLYISFPAGRGGGGELGTNKFNPVSSLSCTRIVYTVVYIQMYTVRNFFLLFVGCECAPR